MMGRISAIGMTLKQWVNTLVIGFKNSSIGRMIFVLLKRPRYSVGDVIVWYGYFGEKHATLHVLEVNTERTHYKLKIEDCYGGIRTVVYHIGDLDLSKQYRKML